MRYPTLRNSQKNNYTGGQTTSFFMAVLYLCSQFVLFMLLLGDVEGTENYKDKMSRVKPSDFKDMDFIDHVRDGTFSMEALPSHLNW